MEPPNTPPPGRRYVLTLLWTAAGLTVLNLLLSASLVSLGGAIVILVMVWGILRGDYPLAGALSLALILYGTVNLIVLAAVLLSGAEARTSALVWLGGYSAAMILLGALLRGQRAGAWLKKAEPPEKREKKIHFFHGGWRDL